MPQHEARTLAVEYTSDGALAIAIETQRKKEGRKTAVYSTPRLQVVKGYEYGKPIPPLDVNKVSNQFVIVSWFPR
jgi:hypothetical protein